MISFKPEWTKHMDGGIDGANCIKTNVEQATEQLLTLTGPLGRGGAGRGIDFALAAACEDADTIEEAYNHLCFICAELEAARLNMRVEVLAAEKD